MANVYHERRWIIDTPSAALITRNSLFVKHVVWLGEDMTALSDRVIVVDPQGGVLYSALALGTHLEGVRQVENWWWDGFAVPTLDGGVLEIWHT